MPILTYAFTFLQLDGNLEKIVTITPFSHFSIYFTQIKFYNISIAFVDKGGTVSSAKKQSSCYS